jgi:hypothetical protein
VQVPRPQSTPGRPRKQPTHLLAEHGYNFESYRRLLRRRGISHTIPERKDHKSVLPGVRDPDLVSKGKLTGDATWSSMQEAPTCSSTRLSG